MGLASGSVRAQVTQEAQGIQPARAPRVVEAGGLPAEAAALLMGTEAGGLLPMEALILPRSVHPDGTLDVEVILQVRGPDVLEGQDETARFEVFAYALDSDDAVQGLLLKVIEIEGDALRERVAATGLEYSGRLRLSPGRYSFRILGRNPVSSAVRLRRIEIDLPGRDRPGRDREPRIFPPIFQEPVGTWARAASPVPPEPGARALIPDGTRATWPVVSGSEVRPFEVLAYALPPAPVLALEVHPRTETGEWGEPLRIEAPVLASESPAPGWTRISSRIPPDEIGLGNHRVRVVLGETGKTRSGDLPLFRGPAPDGEGPQVWASLIGRSPTTSANRTSTEQQPSSFRLGLPRPEIHAELRRAYEDYAKGRIRPALDRLTATQDRALRGSGAAIEALRQAELELIGTIARPAPESLAPFVELYLAAYLDRLAAGANLLHSHNRFLVGDLVNLEVAMRDSPAARQHAAATLVRLATASGRRLTTVSEELYARALEHDPDSEAALLSLATGYERRAEYSEAASQLRQLLSARPEHREAKLRLAVNLGRLREPRAARRLLLELTSEGPADWIRAVAYHELAARLLDRGEIQEVRDLLQQARAVFPTDEKLRFLHAFSLDKQNRPQGAAELLELDFDAAALDSPRFVYGQGLADILRRYDGELATGGEAEMAALRDALAQSS